MSRITDSFLTTFGLVSRIPVPFRYKVEFRYAGFFLPVVGLILTLLLAGTHELAWLLFRDGFAVALALVIVQYFLFNLFHFDGLLDSADALLCFADRERRLEILKDVRFGSFALFVGVVYLAAKLYLLSRCVVSLHQDLPGGGYSWALAVILFSYPVSGRAAAAAIPRFLSPAREGGLGSLVKTVSLGQILLGTFVAVLPGLTLALLLPRTGWGRWSLTAYAGIVVGFLAAYIPYRSKIGGYTGDAQGLAVEAGEIGHLLIFFTMAVLTARSPLG